MNLATKLVTLRKQKGLTQMDLAEQLNVSRQAISRWEVGAAIPSIDNLRVLSELYETSVDYLLNDDVAEHTESTRETEVRHIVHEIILQKPKRKPLVIWGITVILALAVLFFILISRPNHQDQSIPLEDMHTEYKENYSEGTFEFK